MYNKICSLHVNKFKKRLYKEADNIIYSPNQSSLYEIVFITSAMDRRRFLKGAVIRTEALISKKTIKEETLLERERLMEGRRCIKSLQLTFYTFLPSFDALTFAWQQI